MITSIPIPKARIGITCMEGVLKGIRDYFKGNPELQEAAKDTHLGAIVAIAEQALQHKEGK